MPRRFISNTAARPRGLSKSLEMVKQGAQQNGATRAAIPEAAPSWFRRDEDSTRIGERVVAPVCKCHVPHAEVVKLTQNANGIANLMCAGQKD